MKRWWNQGWEEGLFSKDCGKYVEKGCVGLTLKFDDFVCPEYDP